MGRLKRLLIRIIIWGRRILVGKNGSWSLLSNNCLGGDISRKSGLRYNSPTLNLQILPSQWCEFCLNVDYYLNQEIRELSTFDEEQRKAIKNLYGVEPEDTGFPFAILGGRIVLCLQHYKSFLDGKIAWDRRKSRVKRKAFVYASDSSFGRTYAVNFYDLDLPNSLIVLINAEKNEKVLKSNRNVKVVYCRCPIGKHFMNEYRFFKAYYEACFSGWKWVRRLKE